MKRKIIISAIIAIVIGLVIVGFSTGVLIGTVFPMLKKAAMAVPPKMWIRLLFKFLVLTGLMGYITKTVNARKERFLNGEVDYRLDNNYSLIVGYDFQARPLIKRLLSNTADARVLLITDCNVRAIRAEMNTELTKKESARLMFMRRDLALPSTYSGLRIHGANAVYILGDEGVSGRDGIVLRASEMLAAKVESESLTDSDMPVKAYLQFEDPGIYSQMCSQKLSMDRKDQNGNALFDLEVFNYYDSWVWKCWSERNSADGDTPYLPLRFKADAERVELFVIGSGKATRAVVYSAITLMNYGEDARHCRMTVVSDRSSEILPPDDVINALPELEIAEYSSRDLNRKVSAKMLEAAAEEKTAVTIVIVEDAPDKAVKTYLGLPFALRNKEISVLLWMGSQSRNIPEKSLIQVVGDRTKLRYFGMTDCPPWYGSDRLKLGVAVQYYYSECYDDKRMPKGTDVALIAAAKSLWNEEKANQEWTRMERWRKWSSASSASSFKEKTAIICGSAMTLELQLKLLKAEHNRWWSERLLGDWRLGARDNERRLHPNLVPFEELDDFTKDIDKLCIAAMAQQGFIGGT